MAYPLGFIDWREVPVLHAKITAEKCVGINHDSHVNRCVKPEFIEV